MVSFPDFITRAGKIWSVLHSNALFRFGLHTIRNIAIFLIIAIAALILHEVVVFLEELNMPVFITGLLTFGEYGALVIDVVWFLGDLGIRAIRLLIALWKKPVETGI